MMFQVGDDGVVSSVNEEDLIYVDKNELEQFVESYDKLEKENEQLKEDNMLLIEDSEKYRKLSIQFDNRNKELISENEQLKKNIQEKEEVIGFYQRFCGKVM